MKIKLLPLFAVAAVALLVTVGPVHAELIGHWEFDNSGDVGQATVSSDLETVGDAAYSASGKIGGALALDGSGDYLRVDESHTLATGLPTGDASYTLAAFIQTTTNGGRGIIGWGNYGSNGQVNAFRTTAVGEFGSTGGILNYGWGGPFDSGVAAGGTHPGTIYDGQWHHVAATYDSTSSTKRLYFDGAEIGSDVVLGNDLNVGSANFRIGSTNGGEFMNGLLDDVRVYDIVLSESEISALSTPDSFDPNVNGDDNYDDLDLNIILSNFVADADPGGGEPDYNQSNLDDLLLVFGSPASGNASTVPEPASMVLLLFGAMGLMGLRRRK